MDADTLHRHGINPSRLDPAPDGPLFRSGWQARVAGADPAPCICCGQPAWATGIHDLPGAGRRWLDWCRACFLTVRHDGSHG